LIYLEFWSRNFCKFLTKEFNLKTGSKIRNESIIPDQIVSDIRLTKACLRGLLDTDGFIGRDGKTFSIRFGSYNKKLLDQVENIGKSNGIFTFRTKKETGTRNWNMIKLYFKEIGSSNPRHIVRFLEYVNGNPVWKKEVLNYYDKYKTLELPFMAL
jgi:DNA-binding transcriptional regulator WhiA